MHVTDQLLASVFADASAFCGREDVLHAMIYHQLRKAGFAHTRIAREQPLSGGRADVVLYGDSVAGDFETTRASPLVAIEVKGGAYNCRNALADVIDANGYCADMAKLDAEARKGVESWFICVDMQDLGRAVSPQKVKLVAEQCSAHNLSFAYFFQAEERFHVYRRGEQLRAVPLSTPDISRNAGGIGFILNRDDPTLAALACDCLMINGHEANATALLYNYFREAGFGAGQVSLETYFSFAKQPGSRMQERPDLVVFNSSFDGRFNLYKGGDSRLSNDQHKLAHIDTIFEVKGGAAMCRKSDKAVMRDYLKDIDKLSLWRERAAATRRHTGLKTVFMGVDGRSTGLPAGAVETLIGRSRAEGAGLIYISRDRVETVEPQADGAAPCLKAA